MKFFRLFVFFSFIGFQGWCQINPFYVRTTGANSYLNFGLGTDRLGGAKMTYLDSNILLKVVEMRGDFYKVQLSEYHSAWIRTDQVKRAPGFDVPEYLVGSWTVYGDSVYDYVSIISPEKLPYRSKMNLDPTTIDVDIFGAVSNTNWINQRSSAREIRNVWYDQNEDDVMRVHISLNHKTHWGYHIYYDTLQRLTIRIKRQPGSLDLKDITIAIDAGHGGTNRGTRGGQSRIMEKNLTLLYANVLKKELEERGANVFMTRTGDQTLTMGDRLAFLGNLDPTLLVSIHFNASARDTVNGVSTYYRYIGFRPLSKFILAQMLKTGLNEFGNIGRFNFALNGPTEYPGALIEVAFLSNKDDERKIRDTDFRHEAARRIADGIEDFLKSAAEVD